MELNVEFPEKLEFLFEPSRYKVLYGGRGSGKSWGVARALLVIGLQKSTRVLWLEKTERNGGTELCVPLLARHCLIGGIYEFPR